MPEYITPQPIDNLINKLPVPVILAELDSGRIVFANDITGKILKMPVEELLVKSIQDIYPDRDQRKNIYNIIQKQRLAENIQKKVRLGDGSDAEVLISVRSITADGKDLILITINDFTEKAKEAQELQDLLESAPDAIMLINKAGQIEKANKESDKLFGLTRAELRKAGFFDLFDKDQQEYLRELVERYYIDKDFTEKQTGIILTGFSSDGAILPLELSLSPTWIKKKHMVIAVIRDIKERINKEEQLKKTLTELERKTTDIEMFAYSASHDLQEPLRKITAFGELLKNEIKYKVDEKGIQYINIMQTAATRMTSLIDNMLTYAKIEPSLKRSKKVNLNLVFRDIIEDYELMIKEKQAIIQLDDLPEVWGDWTQLRKLFQNLFSNALKFSPPDQAPVIKVEYEHKDKDHIIKVKDKGIGFEMKYSNVLFRPLFKLHGIKQFEGTGLGLAISNKIAIAHHGSITALSEPGKGAEFIVSLPDIEEPEHEDFSTNGNSA